jgi:acetyl esterase/lipase
MQSLRSKLLIFVLRNRHLFRPKRKRDWSTIEEVIRFRQECEDGAKRFGRIPPEIQVVPCKADGLPAEWILPPSGKKNKVIFFVHGGGYVSGSCSDHRIHVAKFVKGTGIGALLYEYRLAPEHPYPAALDDSIKAYRWLLAQGVSSEDIVFAGDSAGGGLCLALLLTLKDRGISLPAAVVALSPWTDLSCSGQSLIFNAKKCLAPEGTATAFSKHYAGDNDPRLPWISPLYGDLRGLPPLLLYAGGDETLLTDSTRFAEKARIAGVDITLHVEKGMFHCYPVCAGLFPEATRAMKEICLFLKGALHI